MAKIAPLYRSALVALVGVVTFAGCGDRREHRVFELLDAKQTGISFANTIATSDSVNELTDVYLYNGAGVGVGDIDNDGLPDIFFAGNRVSSRLYRNLGHMKFEDITAKAGVTTSRWATGVSMVDVNGDGFLDIYVSVSGPKWSRAAERANQLFINNRNGTFSDEAARYGVADTGFTTHAAFLDYDGDGCVDLFLLENSPQDFSRGSFGGQMPGEHGTPGSHNELYRNDCHGSFANVSDRAGIDRDAGFGLGVVIADLNRDGRPDIYVSNDALPNDVVYVNNGNGTFTNRAAQLLKRSSQAGMGVDVADFNNDGWPDIMQADMMPRALVRRKRMSGYMSYGNLLESRGRGFRDDYSMNSLQLSNGLTREGEPLFSEISRLAGVAHTDWSWSVLFADFDNDGNKDIFVGNGYPKAVNDLDYVSALFGRAGMSATTPTRARLEMLNSLPSYAEPNYLFRNTGGLRFADESKAWGMGPPSSSYGAAYADLDNDGRLDLVVNNIDAPAFVYHNVQRADSAHHFLSVRLEGTPPNVRGLGATIVLTAGGEKQYLYQSPYRGYMSTVDDRAHFGLGAVARVDSLEVTWPDGRYQLLTNVAADRMLVVRQSDAGATAPAPAPAELTFEPMAAAHAPRLAQGATRSVDFSVQPLLPYMLSRHGPPLAVADVNGDGRDDFYAGGGSGARATLFIQRADGTFAPSPGAQPWVADSACDDWGALFFDANGDGRPDLYVASGGYQLAPDDDLLQDRLYINRGNGVFTRAEHALPPMRTSTAAVRAADFNGDGRLDLFVGGRLTPRSWPSPAPSYVLRNDGDHFTDVTAQVAPALAHPGGMITDAAWIDFDGDGRVDLVTVGEWMPIQFWRNDGTQLRDVTDQMRLPPTRGWWFSLATGDFDHDGRPDLVAGNLGLNYSYTTSKDSTFSVYAADFTGNRTTDVVLTQAIDGTEYPIAGMAPLGHTIYPLALKFPTYGAFAAASMTQLFGAAPLAQALHYQADTFASVVLHNDGGKGFTLTPLADAAQIAPVRGIVVHDIDGDGRLDLVVAGNLYGAEPNTARADAGNGLWLRGDGRGGFVPVSPRTSGFLAPLDVSGLALVKTITGVGLIVANAGDSLQAFSIRKR
jgi:enediyne biosynthesis protein E4